MNGQGTGNDARTARVAAVRHDSDKLGALDRVLEETGFFRLLDEAAEGREKKDFRIAIKANFMFAYNLRDPTTYTDPELVHCLVERLHEHGYASIFVVEARSTYGVYYQHRSVPEVARYVGYDEARGFTVVDLTTDCDGERDFGSPLGIHPVPRTWRNADFRISFAKNKTHSYAFYTLTIKNIFGALPLENKYEEYHIKRDIYLSTISYLRAFPVHYGLIDAWVSADGALGIYADPKPNDTHTIIGGTDLVAVDWVGAEKMGLDPMVSRYMQEAVQAFGKPDIHLTAINSPQVYEPWENAPGVETFGANHVLDRSHYFGNLLFLVFPQLDEYAFPAKPRRAWVRALRRLTGFIRRRVFVPAPTRMGRPMRGLSRVLYRLER